MTAERTVVRLAESILAVGPLAQVIGQPVRVVPVGHGKSETRPDDAHRLQGVGSLASVFDRLSDRLAARSLELCPRPTTQPTVFEQAISNLLGITPELCASFDLPDKGLDRLDEIIEEVAQRSLAVLFPRSTVESFDGGTLSAYDGGNPYGKALVIVPPCGYPVGLCERWLRHLASDYRVLIWESRGLFPATSEFDSLAHDAEAHARDLVAIMDHFKVASAHAMGLCGGAVVALAAASLHPGRISSLSLWHGDYELGPNCPKTPHQQNLQMLQSMASESRERSTFLHRMFAGPSVLATLPKELAPLLLYPYATPELLYRYVKLNGNIMTTDAETWLHRVRQRTLVVTNEEDTTAHPEGSRQVASRLSNARLHVRPHGGHLSLFAADHYLTDLVNDFLREEQSRNLEIL
jgi:3-oxoadipate enol-lactonase